MKNLTLLVMAAGMGSRFGGLKQLETVGPNNETIIDYSIYDAINAGFNKVIFIIRKEFKIEFEDKITNKFENKIKVEFAFQELTNLPSGYNCPKGRVKPWGTGHAILTAKELLNEPFVVINADDFYGYESFKVIADFYSTGKEKFSLVTFRLDKTLSRFGSVSRGLCQVNNGFLTSVVELENLEKKNDIVSSNKDIILDGSEPVSMNMWGFNPKLFDYLSDKIISFLEKSGNELKSEFLLPEVINELIVSSRETISILNSNSNWFGVTYKEDKPFVVNEIKRLINKEKYPKKLFI
ncbi:MAG: nucleotidyltransferase [Candidatus Marinimicrobia bacterium]|nr:nucleotidyltransferase [Candidatus Neomarinimicrobiota bacterium]|tara:strand:- start:3752 stop:4636 length:885 start_codon:yes stop_codon:yes gene_type:complete